MTSDQTQTDTSYAIEEILEKASRPLTIVEIAQALKDTGAPHYATGTVRNTVSMMIKKGTAIRPSTGHYASPSFTHSDLATASTTMTSRILAAAKDAGIRTTANQNQFVLEKGDWLMGVTIDPLDVNRKGLLVRYNGVQVPIVVVSDARAIIEGILERFLFLQEQAIVSSTSGSLS